MRDPDVDYLEQLALEFEEVNNKVDANKVRSISSRLLNLVMERREYRRKIKEFQKTYTGYAQLPPENTVESPEIDKNYVGMLLEVFQRLKKKPPDFVFSQDGPIHDLTHLCEVHIWTGDRRTSRVFDGAGNTKAEAKRLASFRALQYIRRMGKETP